MQFLRFFLVCVLVILSSLLVLLSKGELSAKPQDSAGQAQEAPERGSLVHRRERWFYDQRRYPLGFIPAGARLKAFRQLQEMVRTVKGLRLDASTAGQASLAQSASTANAIALSQTAWTLIGPQPIQPPPDDPFVGYPTDSGRVTALAFDPRDTTDMTIYLGSAEGGLWVTSNGGQTWTPLTDSEPALAVGSIALDPTTNPTTIYVGTGEQDFNVGDYFGAGVLKSADGGKTWSQDRTFSNASQIASPTASGPYIGALAVAPDHNQTVLAAVLSTGNPNLLGGIWRSTDGASTWTNVLPVSATSKGGAGTGIVFNPAVAGQTFAALSYSGTQNGVYKSNDDGATWTQIFTNTSVQLVQDRLALTPPTANSDGTLLLVSTTPSNGPVLFKAALRADGSVGPFSQLTNVPDFCGPQCNFDTAIALDPANTNVIYAGGSKNFRGDVLIVSTDGGSTWSPDLYAGNGACTSTDPSGQCVNANGQLHTDTHAIAVSPDGKVLLVGTDGGVWSTTNVGVSSNIIWNDLNASLALTQFYPGISILPGNPNNGWGGTQDNGALGYAGSLEWQTLNLTVFCGDGSATAVASTGTVLYDACADNAGIWSVPLGSNSPAVWASNGIGQCTTTVSIGCYAASFAPPLALDPENDSTLYFSAQAPTCCSVVVYQTTSGGANWTPISPDLSNGLTDRITALAVAPSSSSVVYAGTSGGKVWSTQSATQGTSASWTEIDAGLPKRTVASVAVDPGSPNQAYVTFSGFSSCLACDKLGHIFETTDGGATWTGITGNLPDTPVNWLRVEPTLTGVLYVGTDVGVFATTDGGKTWIPMVTGLPNVAVLGLALDPSTRTLWAGTYGRSIWALQLPPPPTVSLSSANLTFATQNAGSASAAQMVTISNAGGMALTIPSITVSGPFAQTNTCGSSLAGGVSCSISITFTPTAAGNVNGTVQVLDDLRSSPQQTIALSGTGQDFAVSSSPSSATVSPGSSASYAISIAPQGGVGFTGPVSLACSAGLPALASCSFSPPSVTPGSASASSILTISTTAPSVTLPQFEPGLRNGPRLFLWIDLVLALASVAAFARKFGQRRAFALASWALLLCFILPILSCGGNSAPRSTRPGTYSVTLTGTSNQLQHSASLTLVVQ